MFLIFDTETTGLPKNYHAPLTDFDNWPRLVQLAWQLHDATGKLIAHENLIVKPEGFTIPYNSEKIHGISTERAQKEGKPLSEVLELFQKDVTRATYLAGHNIEFDNNVMGCELLRMGATNVLAEKKSLDTKELATEFCQIPGGKGGRFKWPTLTELYSKLFNESFSDAHDAAYDVIATGRAFFELLKIGVISVPEAKEKIEYEPPILGDSNFQATDEKKVEKKSDSTSSKASSQSIEQNNSTEQTSGTSFVHLHVHTQYSVLQSTSEVNELIKKAKEWNMPAFAITDHGNMMGAFQFVSAALKANIKPIVGSEFNICNDRLNKEYQDNGFQIPILAKNKNGYHNLTYLSSLSHTEGFYYVPRIDKETLLKFKEDIIVLSGGVFGEVAWTLLNEGEEKAEEAFRWYKENFGDDFYAELNRHGLEEEAYINKFILQLCSKYDVKYIAANSTYYSTQKQASAQDALLCVRDGEFMSKDSKFIGKRGRDFRFGLPNDEYFFKSPDEMAALFADLPLAISNTLEVAEKCEIYELKNSVLLPKFDIPDEFSDPQDKVDGGNRGENNYLRHMTYEGAAKRYGEITEEIKERLEFELETIARTNYPGYFLIVQDFCAKAREMDVWVGPGRGSAAGSAVAYCIGITNVDPIKYSLLFERFLNPDRVGLPDIDTDFEDNGRDKVLTYVREKYGSNMVAQIITYGTMKGKSAIRDAGRVLELPLQDTNKLAKLIPDNQALSFILNGDEKKLKEKLNDEAMPNAAILRTIASGNSLEAQVLRMAADLEGSVRNTGTHACGVIIAPQDITDLIPVTTVKGSDMWCTQFDNSVVEHAGLLKMDFLGLKTLTLIKHALRNIKERHNIDIDIEAIPLDDSKTYELFQKGQTIGVFQYESEGMQKHMKDLKPTVFGDLIAMNALYRPGPMEYIPAFIKRKHGLEEITYDLPEMKEYLEETYGITVYQEQVMLLSQKLANFSKGEADILRKAMGKKNEKDLEKMHSRFMDGAIANGHPQEKLNKIWTDWEAFAKYAFNKSHSTCYAWVAYQTAYLKAHYPAEYMASVLSNNLHDLKQLGFFMRECKKQQISVLGPDVNESKSEFSVNEKGEIRFGLAAIKGVGESAVESIIQEQKNGNFHSLFDFLVRVDAKSTSKKTLEMLAMSGAFDSFGYTRSAYFSAEGKNDTFIDKLVKYAAAERTRGESSQFSLFGDAEEDTTIVPPAPPNVEPWDAMTQLQYEKEVIGMFISGHPLDDFMVDIESFCTRDGMLALQFMDNMVGRKLRIAGMVVTSSERILKKSNKPMGIFMVEDYSDSFEFVLFGEDYLKYKHLLIPGERVFITGTVQYRKYGKEMAGTEFKISSVELLADLREKRARFIDITINIDRLDEKLIDQLSDIIPNTEGNSVLRINIGTDDAPKLKLESAIYNRIEITNNVLNALSQLPIDIKISEK